MVQRSLPILYLIVALALLAPPAEAAEAGSVYGHVSLVDQGATVTRLDGSVEPAVVNLPLAPGDTVATAAGGRCELQFDNGTVIRLDKDSRLSLTSLMARSLTSSRAITTLRLEQGQLVALPQTYNQEMFQVVTSNAAVLLKSRVIATIRLDGDGGTSLFSDGGKFQVLYGSDEQKLQEATVKTGRPRAVTSAHQLTEQVPPRTIEFIAWNEYLDRHFQELHRGVAVVPKLPKFGNLALRHWAEKWSSRYGEWVYDDLFGYVWRPADEQFALSARPFFHADYVRMNGQLFLVPQQAWGWVPAHMGTWVWMKRGWTWIPGDWFHNGVVEDMYGNHTVPTFFHYWSAFNWFQRPGGRPDWPDRRHGEQPPPVPGPLQKIIKRVLKAPDGNEIRRTALGYVVPGIEAGKLPKTLATPMANPVTEPSAKVTPLRGPEKGPATNRAGETFLLRDWNPDHRWAIRNGGRIRYRGNAIVCPELPVPSRSADNPFDLRQRGSTIGRDGTASSNDPVATPATSGSPGAGAPVRDNPGDRTIIKDDKGR